MTDRDRERVSALHPFLAERIEKVIEAMSVVGFPMTVVQGLRTTEDQAALYAKGRTTPGPIVTNADGIVHKSKHQSGRAVDCAFVRDGTVSWSEALPWQMYGEMGKALGLLWGGDWKSSLVDRPHLELPPEIP